MPHSYCEKHGTQEFRARNKARTKGCHDCLKPKPSPDDNLPWEKRCNMKFRKKQ